MNLNIPWETAKTIAERRCSRANVELVYPDDPRRTVVAGLVALAHKLQKTGVTAEHVEERITVTLPGVPGAAMELLALIPFVGVLLKHFAGLNGRTAIYLARAVTERKDSVALLATVEHELGHAGNIAAGGLAFCLAYLIASEARGGTEAPCYGASMVVEVGLDGRTVEDAEARALESISGYGFDADTTILARALIQSAAETIRQTGDYGQILFELYQELTAEGVVL